MKQLILFIAFAFVAVANGCSQTGEARKPGDPKQIKGVGGGCEGCEAIYESPVPFEKLKSVDTLPDYYEVGAKISISGIVYKADGRTPAKDVVLYVYHTDQKGLYATRGIETGWGKRHGYIRGWVKTDENGFYAFYTLVPASYPNRSQPKHIHPVIKEPGKNEYYIDEFLFDDDPLLTAAERKKQEQRGGNGIIKTVLKDGILQATRHIILGRNIPAYPG